MFTVSFVTSNPEKLKEFEEVHKRFKGLSIKGERYNELPEIVGSAYTDLIENKALAAFRHFRRPVIVDHASLQVKRLNNLPGPASKPFWQAIGTELHDILSKLAFDHEGDSAFAATVRVDVAYCDDHRLIPDFAEVSGRIVQPSGHKFEWDQCFSPSEADGQSYADMDPQTKDKFSARSKAFEKLLNRVKELENVWR